MAATCKDTTRKALTGVLIQTDGTVVATNGAMLVICRNCVEKFEGKNIIVKTPPFSVSQINSESDATIILDGKEGHVKFYVKNKRQIMVADVIDSVFPDWKEIDNDISEEGTTDSFLAFNAKYVYDIAKIASIDGQSVRFVMSSKHAPVNVFFHDKEDDIKMVLMPIRT